jgi:hypothetical protein
MRALRLAIAVIALIGVIAVGAAVRAAEPFQFKDVESGEAIYPAGSLCAIPVHDHWVFRDHEQEFDSHGNDHVQLVGYLTNDDTGRRVNYGNDFVVQAKDIVNNLDDTGTGTLTMKLIIVGQSFRISVPGGDGFVDAGRITFERTLYFEDGERVGDSLVPLTDWAGRYDGDLDGYTEWQPACDWLAGN